MNFAHFQALYDGLRIDPVIVCNLEAGLAKQLGARVTRVLLSQETLRKQKSHHPDLSVDDYVALRPALLYGEVRQDGPRTAVVLFIDRHQTGFGVRASLKVTADGKAIYATSFCRLRRRTYARQLAKPYSVIRPHGQI